METTNDAQDTPTGEPPMRLKQRLTKRRGDARTARQSTRTDRRESRTARHDNEGRRQAGPTSENTHCETTHRGTTGNGQQSNERWDDRRAIKTAASADHYTSRVQWQGTRHMRRGKEKSGPRKGDTDTRLTDHDETSRTASQTDRGRSDGKGPPTTSPTGGGPW